MRTYYFNYNGEERNLVESKIPMGKKLWVPRYLEMKNHTISYDEVEILLEN